MKTEKEKMLAGELHCSSVLELTKERENARRLPRLFNETIENEHSERTSLLKELFGSTSKDINIEPSLRCDYGSNIHVGENFYANFASVFLDVCEIRIGDNCMIAPGAIVTKDVSVNVVIAGKPGENY